MIQPLRTAHCRVFIVLAGLLPVVIVGGLSERHRNELSGPMPLAIPQAAARLRSVSAVWGQNTLTTEFYSDTAHQVRVRLLPNPFRELHDPDLLLYWATNAGAVPDDLSNAVLLGPFLAGKEYSIPPKQVAGYLILYSLAHRTIVDRAKVEVRP